MSVNTDKKIFQEPEPEDFLDIREKKSYNELSVTKQFQTKGGDNET